MQMQKSLTLYKFLYHVNGMCLIYFTKEVFKWLSTHAE